MGKEMIELIDLTEFDNVMSQSTHRPQLIFKHSTACPISMTAYNEMDRYLENGAEELDYWMIIVQHARNISNAAAERLGVQHESPQAIIIRGGRAVWNASHYDITTATLSSAIKANL